MSAAPSSANRSPLGSVGLWRAVVKRSRADWPMVLAAWLLLLCAITLLVAGALYADAVVLGGLRRAVTSAPAADRTIAVQLSAASSDVEKLDRAVSGVLKGSLGPGGGEVDLAMRSGSFLPADVSQEAGSANLTLLASQPAIARHAALVSGSWPESGADPLGASLSEGAARALGLSVGDHVRLVRTAGSTDGIDLVISGIWRPDTSDPYWRDDPLELDGITTNGQYTTRGPFMINADDLRGEPLAADLSLEWRAVPAVAAVSVDRLADVRQSILAIPGRLKLALPPRTDFRVETELPTILDGVRGSILVSRSGILLLTIEFAVLAGYAIVLVAGMLLERRRPGTALLRERGATSGQFVGMAFAEALLLAASAAALAPWLAAGVVGMLGSIGPLSGQGLLTGAAVGPSLIPVAIATAAACVVILTLPAMFEGASPVAIRATLGRQVGRTLPQRLGVDILLVVLAVIALWQLRLYGAPLTRDTRGALGLDPLLVAAPAVGLLAGAILATRIVPRLAELGERILGQRRGLVPPLGARQLARRPLRYTRAALLLVLAFALGTYAAASAATWTRSQIDQAAYQAAADARAIQPDYPKLPDWGTGSAYRAVDGVTGATPVEHASINVGKAVRNGRLVAVDASAVGRIFASRPGAVEPGVSDGLVRLVAARPSTSAILVPGEPKRLAMTLDADVRIPPPANCGGPCNPDDIIGFPPDQRGLGLTLVVVDADGHLSRLDLGDGLLVGKDQRMEVALHGKIGDAAVGAAFPLRIEAIEVAIEPRGTAVVGSVALRSLEVSPDGEGSAWTSIPFDPGAAGLTWLRHGAATEQSDQAYNPPAGSPGRIEVTAEDNVGGSFSESGDDSVTFRLWAAPEDMKSIPVIASRAFLENTGAHVGDTIAVDATVQQLEATIVAATDGFPSLDPAIPFLVADGPTLELERLADSWNTTTPDEWWLTIAPGRESSVAAVLAGAPYSAQVIDRQTLIRSLTGDPIQLGVLGALALGALAAIAIATIGFLVNTAVSTSERRGELALLRAMGLSGRELSTWLTVEHAFLLTVGLLAGIALGVVLAWLVLPYATLSVSGQPPFPRPVPVLPWEAIALLAALTVGLLGVTVLLLARLVPGPHVGGIIRSTEVT